MPSGGQFRTVVEGSERRDVTREAVMKNRVKSPPRYPICSEITHDDRRQDRR